MATTSICPAAQDLENLLKGQLPTAQREAVLRHLLDCQRCAEVVRLLARTGDPDPTELLSSIEGRAALLTRLGRHLSSSAGASGAPTAPLGDDPDASSVRPTREHITLVTEGSVPPVVISADDLPTLLTPAQRPDEIGRLGSYRVLRRLGSGGMGVVFGAEDPSLGRLVALKVLLPSLAADAAATERFLREARIMASLKHDNVVTIYQVDQDRGIPYLAMELLEGETLDRRVRRDRTLPLPEVIRIGREAAEGLAAAHARGVIHRDIKPANLWLEAETGRVKILDFGLARAVDSGPGLTQKGIVMGTPAYMAPEQARGEKVGPACDLFSLGCVLYELCTGQMLFHRADTMSTMMAVVNDHPPPPCDFRPDVPLALSNLIMRMLAKAPAQRPETAQAVVEVLKHMDDSPVLAARRAPPPTPASDTPSAGAPHRGRLAAILFLVLLTVGAGFGFFYSGEIALFLANKGEVVVPAADTDEVEVVVKDGQGNDVEKQTGAVVRLPAGNYVLEVTVRSSSGDLRFLTREVVLQRGTRETLSLANVRAVRQAHVLPHPGEVYAIACSYDGKHLASGNRDGTVKIWDVASGKELFSIGRTVDDDSDAIHALAFNPDGTRLAGGDAQGVVREWGPTSGKTLRTLLPGMKELVAAVAYSPDGKLLAAGSWDRTIRLWDVETGVPAPSQSVQADKVGALAFPNNRHLAIGSYDGTVAVVDLTGAPVLTHKGHTHNVLAVTFDPDGSLAASADWNRVVRIWDASTGNLVKSMRGASHSVSFDPKGRWLAGGDWKNQTTRVWDAATGEEVLMLPRAGHKAVFSPAGKFLVTGGTLGRLLLWDVSSLADDR
ncbi:MAG: protein kinase [Planctomycetes bacterium]|nr:protein kinase [Planctomycetota bacterium]